MRVLLVAIGRLSGLVGCWGTVLTLTAGFAGAETLAPQSQPVTEQERPVAPQAPPGSPPPQAPSHAQPVVLQTTPVLIDRIAAVVNQEVITLSEVQEAVLQQAVALAASRGETKPRAGDPAFAASTLTPQAISLQLHRLVDRKLQEEEAAQKGIAVTEAELTRALEDIKMRNRFASDAALASALATEGLTMEQYRRQLRSELLAAKLVSREVRSTVVVAPEEVRRYYDQHQEEFSLPERVKLRQIFFAAPAGNEEARANKRAKAQTVLDELKRGADFDQLARRYSDGAEAGEGGELGWFTPGTLMAPLDRTAFTLQDGQISDLIESPLGWHILKAEAHEGHRQQSFDQVKDQVHEQLLNHRTQQRYEEWFLELRQNAYVDIRL
ncbi:MAG TPA: peptidylprolyl isomerase [Nitrospiria bacterium]|nr:peptidylprolyl isomerase [Nitrospiria bacterium]